MASTYCTWDEYVTIGGRLEANAFHQHAVRAEDEIREATYGRADAPPAAMQANLIRCMRDMVEKLHELEKRKQLLPAGIHSVNNDGLAVTAESGFSEADEIRAVCRRHLIRPVNLMHNGVKQP